MAGFSGRLPATMVPPRRNCHRDPAGERIETMVEGGPSGTGYGPCSSPSPRARWNAERQAGEFGVEIGEYLGIVRVHRRVFQRLLPERPSPEKCVEAYYLQRTRFENIAERKIRRRQLTGDGNVEISGRDLR